MTEKEASRGFLIGCTVGPLVGLVLGGPFFDFFGGYRNGTRARLLCMIIGLTALILSPIMLYPPSPVILLAAVSANAGIIGMIIPALSGILLTSVPGRLRSMASGVYGTIVNIIGFQAGPVIVGFMSDFSGDFMTGWRTAIAPCIVGAPLILVCAWLRARVKPEESQEETNGTEGAEGQELRRME
jgi:MFS family permease